MSNLTREELLEAFRSVGEDVRVHRSVVVFGGERIDIAPHVRIDAFSILSAGDDGIEIGNHVHVAAGVYLYGSGGRITLAPFSGLSSRVVIYTANDDYRDGHLTGPMVPDALRNVATGAVRVGRHAVVGAGSVVLPGSDIGAGAAVGALSLVRGDVPPLHIFAGIPARHIGIRADRMASLEAEVPS